MRPHAPLPLTLIALCSLVVIPDAHADEASSLYEHSVPEPAPIRLRARLDIPLVSAELMNNSHGTQALLGGSFGVDFDDLILVEVGGVWLDTEPSTGWEAFVRAGALWTIHDSRGDTEGWLVAIPTTAGYRFLRDADEAEGLEGATSIHAITLGAGWQATWFWEGEGLGLELRVMPTFSIPVAEEAEGSWGETAPTMGGSVFSRPNIIGNSEEMSLGFDLELTVGLAF